MLLARRRQMGWREMSELLQRGLTGARRRELPQVGNELSCVLGRWLSPRRSLNEPVFRGTN